MNSMQMTLDGGQRLLDTRKLTLNEGTLALGNGKLKLDKKTDNTAFSAADRAPGQAADWIRPNLSEGGKSC